MKCARSKCLAAIAAAFFSLQLPISSARAQCPSEWTQPQVVTAPTPRLQHALVFDSARNAAVLFGGIASINRNAETWEWDGTAWTLMTPAASPSARNGHAMAYDSDRELTVLFGGTSIPGLSQPSQQTWEWDGANWTQKLPAAMPSARQRHALAYDSARKATVLFGGQDNALKADTWVWTGQNWLPKSPAVSPSARELHAMAFDSARGVVVLFGGNIVGGGLDGETWEWNGANWSQKTPALSPSPRYGHAMTYDAARQRVVLFGGNVGARDGETWEWNGTNWARALPQQAPSPRDGHALAYDSARDVTWLFGGFTTMPDNETWQWRIPRVRITTEPAALSVTEGQSAIFSVAASQPEPTTYAWRKNGAPLADGGPINGATTASLTLNPTTAEDAGDYDCEVSIGCDAEISQTATLTVAPPACGACGAGVPMMMPLALVGLVSARRRRASVGTQDRKAIPMISNFSKVIPPVFFLVFSFQFPVSSAMAQCAGEWLQLSPGNSPSAREYHAMAYDSNRGVSVLFGGTPMGGDSSETWEWDGMSWSKKNPAESPTARSAHAMAYDAAREVTVLFGGYTNNYNAETWEWSGANWTNKNPPSAPSARKGHALAYDSARHVTVLFGGHNGADLGDTWEWDGQAWSQKSPGTSPAPRQDFAMAYDSIRGVTVLFGGTSGSDQTWEWDGTSWTRRFPASKPTSDGGHSLTYDSSRGVTVLFGGLPSNNQTWEWNGTDWMQRTPTTKPSPRYRHAAAFDSAKRVTVLFGGISVGVRNDQTWLWEGPGPFIIKQPDNQNVTTGQAAAFSITGNGPGPLMYQWRKDGAPLSDGGAIAGAATAALTINPAADADAGSYDCKVSNSCGDVPSQAAALTITPPPASCGACGAGVPMMMPFALWAMVAARRRRVKGRDPQKRSPL